MTPYTDHSPLAVDADALTGGVGTEVTPTRPDKEYVVVDAALSPLEEVPYDSYARLHRRQPLRVLRAMMHCPPIRSSLLALKSMILSGGFQLTPAIAPSDDEQPDPDEELSLRILEECKRAATRMEVPLEVWAWEMLDAMAERNKLSEVVLAPYSRSAGPDAGRFGIRALKVKPRWSYRYRVDLAMNVVAIDCYTVDREWASLDPDHFAWLSWDARDSDPRGGDSLLDAAYHAFNLLMQLWPEFALGNRKWGSPSLFLTTSPHAKPMVPPRDDAGREIPGGRPVTAERAMARDGDKMKGGATLAAPPGATATVIESTRDGKGIIDAIQLLEAQTIVCVLLQTRMTREAQHGSKADSETGSDVAVNFVQFGRQWLCQAPRKAFRAMVRANYDDDVAARLTPHVSLGRIDPRNFAAIAQAVGLLYQSGYFTEPQMLWLDTYLGLPQRRPGDSRIGPQRDNAAVASPDPGADRAVAGMFAEIRALILANGGPA